MPKQFEPIDAAGWLPGATQLCSPNYDSRPYKHDVHLVVLHSISLPPGRYHGDAVERLFMGRLDPDEHPYYERIRGARLSAHFVIRRNGQLLQFVSCNERAWHAGVSAWNGRPRCNDFSVGVELEGLEGDPFEEAQYETLIPLLDALCDRYPIKAVAGHEHVAPDRKTDPGPGFQWSRLNALANARGLILPPAPATLR